MGAKLHPCSMDTRWWIELPLTGYAKPFLRLKVGRIRNRGPVPDPIELSAKSVKLTLQIASCRFRPPQVAA
jgi:hypothetical protein